MKDNQSIHKRFICLSIFFGMLFILLMPPFQSPDEDSHFKKAYVIAEGNVFPDLKDGQTGYYLPTEMVQYMSDVLQANSDLDYKFAYRDIISLEHGITDYSNRTFEHFSTVSTNPIAHIVPAIGIVFGKLIGKIAGITPSFVCLLYFARFANLMGYVILVVFSIYLSPVLKKTMSLFGLIPMSLMLGSMVSYDMILISVSFLYVSLCLRLMYNSDSKWNWRYTVVFTIIAFLFFTIKIIYLPMFLWLLLILLQDKDKYKIVKRIIFVLVLFITLYLLTSVIPGKMTTVVASETGTTLVLSPSQQQLRYVIQHPIAYMKIFLHTLSVSRNFYITSTVSLFGLLDTYMFTVFVYIYAVLLILVGIAEVSIEKIIVKWYYKLSIIFGVLAAFFGAFLAMYIIWTSLVSGIGASSIEGVQGRYFLPVLFPVTLLFSNQWIAKKKYINLIATKLVEYSELISVSMLSLSMLTILLRFWV